MYHWIMFRLSIVIFHPLNFYDLVESQSSTLVTLVFAAQVMMVNVRKEIMRVIDVGKTQCNTQT